MSLLINNNLLWISVPRCASLTIETDLINSNLNIQKASILERYPNKHFHLKRSQLYSQFGIFDTICIKRDWFDRWLSALQYFFDATNNIHQLETIINWEEIDNNFIYKHFDYDFCNKLYNPHLTHNGRWKNWEIIYKRLVKTDNLEFIGHVQILLSQNFWKENEECTYEFDIKEIDSFYKFLENKYNYKFEKSPSKQNINNKTKSKIIVNNELKNFVWDGFEKLYKKSNII